MEQSDIRGILKEILEVYSFPEDTLSAYLGVSKAQLEAMVQHGMDALEIEEQKRVEVSTKICFLYFAAAEDKDLELTAFLEVLCSFHQISEETIGKMAGVESEYVKKLRASCYQEVPMDVKYKIAVTVMALRFFLKEMEPSPQHRAAGNGQSRGCGEA